MYALHVSQLEACLERIVERIQQVRQLDLSVEAQFQQALEESRHVLGAVARYRGLLKQVAAREGVRQRVAA